MKKIITFFCFLIAGLPGFSQAPPTTCPTITFSYDASGNRIQRKLIITDCSVHKSASEEYHTDSIASFPVSVYPNPTLDKVNIVLTKDSTETESSVLLLDMSGKTVYSAKTSVLQMQIDVSGLAAGTYLLKITRGKSFATFNVMKN